MIPKTVMQRTITTEYVMPMDTRKVKKKVRIVGMKTMTGLKKSGMKRIGTNACLIKYTIRYTLGQKSYHSSNSEPTSTSCVDCRSIMHEEMTTDLYSNCLRISYMSISSLYTDFLGWISS